MSKTPVWFDADMGADDVLAILMALGSCQFKPLGLSTVFGNVSGDKALNNAAELLTAFGRDDIPLFKGADKPLVGSCPFGDDAYGDDGFGGIRLTNKESIVKIDSKPAHLGLINAVLSQNEKVTVFGTGPVTNLAKAIDFLENNPQMLAEFKDKIKLVLMSGALGPGPFPNPPGRIGNITLHAEFNAHMDPYALSKVLGAKFDTHIVTMDATQHTSLTKARQDLMRQEIGDELSKKLISMIRIVEELDTTKFGSNGPFIHDPQVVSYALNPEDFEARNRNVSIQIDPPEGFDPTSRHGRYDRMLSMNVNPPKLVTGIYASPDKIFAGIVSGIKNMAPEYQP